MPKLFESIKIREVEIRNRIFLSPMCQYACETRDGVVGDYHLVHLGARAVGGFGLIIAEATGVSPEGRITPWCPGIWNDEQVFAWSKINDFAHANGAKTGIQLAHAGRKASIYRDFEGATGSVPISKGGWQTVSSTSEAFTGYDAPRELTTAEVAALPATFASAARRALKAGFDLVEIHAAHGYLIHQFLSPITNQRQDEYGGSAEGRAKVLLEIIKAVREEVGAAVPVFVRLSATDYREDGLDLAATQQISRWAQEAGADLMDISTGGLITGVTIPSGPGYQVPFAEGISEAVAIPVTAVGQITNGAQAEQILDSSKVSAVMIGRAGLRDPYWPLRAAHELGAEIDYWIPNYNRGKFPKA
jgi:2,4-dienoyl-CoA reductase-like NADH-dependent reductase (Old Yellow Enzyme family)